MPRDTTRRPRFDARLSLHVLAVIKPAAQFQGRSFCDCAVAAAQEIALRTIENASVIRLSIQHLSRFVDLLILSTESSTALQHVEFIETNPLCRNKITQAKFKLCVSGKVGRVHRALTR